MKRLILLFIITILIKGYANDCLYDGTVCNGSKEGKFQCLLDSDNGVCIQKYYCDNVVEKNINNCEAAITSNEATKCVYDEDKNECQIKEKCLLETGASQNSDCENIQTSEPDITKCVFDSEESGENKCKVKKICKPNLEVSDCNSAITLTPQTTKCQYNGDLDSNNCEVKELCEIEPNPSFDKCKAIPVSDSTNKKCSYDSEKCVVKTLCSSVVSPSAQECSYAITEDEIKTKCVLNEGSTCSTENRECNEITNGTSSSICESVVISNGNECTYDETQKKCKEIIKCLNVGTITDETKCPSSPTSDDVTKKCVVKTVGSVKRCDEEPKACTEIKNGATKQICNNAPVSDDTTKKCELNSSKPGECIETDKGSEPVEQTEKHDSDSGGNDSKTEKKRLEIVLKKQINLLLQIKKMMMIVEKL